MASVTSTPALLGPTPLTIGAFDTCDPCGDSLTQALVAVRLNSGSDLYFCGHHYGQHETALTGRTLHVLDTRPTVAVA